MVSDEIFCSFRPQKGIRQGDPLSPYLFLLMVDFSSRSITDACQKQSMKGIKMTREYPQVSHILFADDFLLFLHVEESIARNDVNLLEEYCHASGQQINYHKSSVMFSPNTSPRLKNWIVKTLKIPESTVKGKYLGLTDILGKSKL